MARRVVSIRGDGNCLFRSLAHCVLGSQERHRDVRASVVRRVAANWTHYRDFIIGDPSYKGVRSAGDYAYLMGRDGEYAGHVELHSASEEFPQYTFKVHIHGGEKTIDYGYGARVCHLLFTGFLDAGHYSVIY